MSLDRERHPVDLAKLSDEAKRAVEYLRSSRAIRERAQAVFAAGLAGKLSHFIIDLDKLDRAAERVLQIARATYPDLRIPYHSRWGHFRAGGVDRVAELAPRLSAMDLRERGRCLYDLVVTSALLGAGAGSGWRYHEAETGKPFSRSEGLAVASFRMFMSGAFSSAAATPLRADAAGLRRINAATLGEHFQAGNTNHLVGVSGRAALMQRLGEAIERHPEIFAVGPGTPRAGHLFDYLCDQAVNHRLPAARILDAVLQGLSPIWPGRITIGGVNLGDVWHHDAAGGDGLSARLVPLHKLSQWLAYSLIEPLEDAGIHVVDLDQLTGLPEYRNGGLFVDTGVLVPRHAGVTAMVHRPGVEVVVEWRALTVALVDRIAEMVRQKLGKTPDELPLPRIVEAGTWRAGRAIAAELRPDGSPPIRIDSDGTVF